MEKQHIDIKKTEVIIEGLLFAAGSRVSLDRISKVIGMEKGATRTIINNMIFHYNSAQRGIMIREINDAYQMCTRPEIYDHIKIAFEQKNRQGLTKVALESLAVIAYNGPITRAKVEQIRGVNSDRSISSLIEKNLIRETGRLDAPGKPSLFDVTEEFFRQFGFSSKADLPVLEMNELSLIEDFEEKISKELD